MINKNNNNKKKQFSALKFVNFSDYIFLLDLHIINKQPKNQ